MTALEEGRPLRVCKKAGPKEDKVILKENKVLLKYALAVVWGISMVVLALLGA
jgi:hypothetical protein